MDYGISKYPYSKQNSKYNKSQFTKPNVSYAKPNFKGSITQPDTFSASNQLQPKKEGMSTGAKWGLGTIAVVGLGALTYVLSKGKIGAKQTQQLAEHIDFKPAKTIEEAINFGQNKLKISYNDYQNANLDMLNTINEMFSKNIKKDKTFDIVHFESRGADKIANPMGFSFINNGNYDVRVLRINTDYIDKFDNLIEYVFKHNDGIDINKIIKRNNNDTYSLVKQEYGSEFLNKLIDKLNLYNSKSSYKDKLEIYDGFSELVASYNNILKGKNTMKDFSFDGSFMHESGHSLHYKSSPKIYNSLLDNKSELVREFQNNDIQQIAQKVSDYAKSDPLEFVAEVYKGVQRGNTYNNDIMTLYKKYDGPALS